MRTLTRCAACFLLWFHVLTQLRRLRHNPEHWVMDKCLDKEQKNIWADADRSWKLLTRLKGSKVSLAPLYCSLIPSLSWPSPTLPPTHLCPHEHPGPFFTQSDTQIRLFPSLLFFPSLKHAHAHIPYLPSCLCTWAGSCHHRGNWHTAGHVTITCLIFLWKREKLAEKGRGKENWKGELKEIEGDFQKMKKEKIFYTTEKRRGRAGRTEDGHVCSHFITKNSLFIFLCLSHIVIFHLPTSSQC